ncbi:subtilisin-like protease 8 [Lingula anatina]|uniref:Subtilisin-like protease 8 n=1 Tax=Lingula anatina TaxID=7574 RepID=A0A1S3HAI8_LINAN|nr:subtilisin-like protease 8 [Lingula anatina]|eukprot:XP_013383047.1 subtilisin-like protease 8 [Lingula anatina]
MKTILFLLAVLCYTSAYRAPIMNEYSKTAIPNEYIVVFNESASSDAVLKHMKTLPTHLHTTSDFVIGKFRGYGVKAANKSHLEHVRNDPIVKYVEPNMQVKAFLCAEQKGAPWGLARTSTLIPDSDPESDSDSDWKELNPDLLYEHDTTGGQDVTVYVIDTGIRTTHEDFTYNGEQQAKWGTSTVMDPDTEEDLNGHGTHVAGTIIGQHYGIAKRATAIAVQVLNANGFGSNTGVIKGMEWVVKEHQKAGKKTSIANMSLGGGFTLAMNEAVDSMFAAGVLLVAAAGNDNADACNYSPASAENAVTVGCTDINDSSCYFSNWGKCNDIYAPGLNIESTWIDGDSATKTISASNLLEVDYMGVIGGAHHEGVDLCLK